MANTLAIIRAVLALLPVIIEAVKAIEAAFPMGGAGQQKLAAVRALVESSYGAASNATIAFEALWPTVSATIGAVVTLANSTGVFKTSAQPAQ